MVVVAVGSGSGNTNGNGSGGDGNCGHPAYTLMLPIPRKIPTLEVKFLAGSLVAVALLFTLLLRFVNAVLMQGRTTLLAQTLGGT